MRNESVFWGLILVLLGGLLLMDNLGFLPVNINVWTLFWPLILIGLGVRGIMRAFAPRTVAEGETLRLPLDGAQAATVRFHHGAGELRVDDRAGPEELLNGAFTGGVEHHVSQGPENVLVDLRVPGDSLGSVITPFDTGRSLNWTVGLNPSIPLNLDLELGASRNTLNLRNLQVRDLRLQTGASSTELELPERAGLTRATIKSGAASVEVRIPEGVSAAIHAHGGLASIDVDTARFPHFGSDYRSPEYDIAVNRVDLEIETGVGSVRVR